MKKGQVLILSGFLSLMGMIGLRGSAEAAPTANITVTVTVQKISLSVTDATVAFGMLSPDTDVVVADTTTVTNDGNIQEDFQLNATHTGDWTQSMVADPGADAYDLLAAFDASINNVTNAALTAGNTEDSLEIGAAARTATTDAFAVNGSGTGYDVPPLGSRNLFFLFRAPKTNTATAQQSFTVTVTAIPG